MTADRLQLAIAELVAALRAELAPPDEPSALVDIATTARLLGIGRTSVYSLLDSGALPSTHIGRRRLVPREAITAFTKAAPEPEPDGSTA